MDTEAIILSEGTADDTFLRELIKARSIGNFHIRPPKPPESGGDTGFAERLKGLKLLPGIEHRKAIIIVADNDDNPAEAFQAIKGQIESAGGYAVPNAPLEIAKNGTLPQTSALMLPWIDTPGCLDTICLVAAAKKRPKIAECVEAYVTCAEAGNWKISNLAKLKLRCLFSAACEHNPNTGIPFAWSTDKGRPGDLIPLEDVCFDQITSYLSMFA